MREHFLTRTRRGESVCACGFRPEILGTAGEKPVGVQWKAKADVLNHIDGQPTITGAETGLRSPARPFRRAHDVKFPRAGVRRQPDGQWLLTLWDEQDVVHELDEVSAVHTTRYNAICTGQMIIDAHRSTGTRLNGLAA